MFISLHLGWKHRCVFGVEHPKQRRLRRQARDDRMALDETGAINPFAYGRRDQRSVDLFGTRKIGAFLQPSKHIAIAACSCDRLAQVVFAHAERVVWK
jgi:hypothetical protein